ncbi:MAG: hypothetical protein IKG39_06110 [Lachnospiraceae bacterium]|nr:hypothetical protein [Lachnospiraceae bacterium]
MRAMKKARQDLSREMDRQIDILYAASAVVWWVEYGWRTTRIMRRFQTSTEIWTECADYGVSKSMFQMLEEETGIEMSLSGYDRSYHEFSYLDGDAWDGKLLTLEQTVYMHQQQKKWLAPLILASICLSLHRDDHWGAERIAKFISQVDKMRQEYGERPDRFRKLMEEVTDLPVDQILGGHHGK